MRAARFALALGISMTAFLGSLELRALDIAPSAPIQAGDCDKVLVQEVTIDNRSAQTRLAWLTLASYDDYQKKYKDASADLGYGPFSAGGSQSEFETNKRSYLSKAQFQYDSEEVRTYYRQAFSDKQVEQWGLCMAARNESGGVVLRFTDFGDDSAALRVKYRSDPTRSTKITISLDGGTTNGPTSFTLHHDGEQPLIIRRPQSSKRVLITASTDSQRASSIAWPAVYVAPPPPPPTQTCGSPALVSRGKPATASHAAGSAGAVTNGNISPGNWNSGTHAYPHAPVWVEIDLGSPHIVTHLRLNPEQTPTVARTFHRITGFTSDGSEIIFADKDAITQSGAYFDVVLNPHRRDIRRVRVQTTISPAWVSWREIEVYGCR